MRDALRSRVTAAAGALACVVLLSSPAFAVDAELRKRARSDDNVERKNAAWALAREGSPEAGKLLRKLLTDESTWVRDCTVEACIRLKRPDGLKELVSLTRVSKAWKRCNAVEAIGRSRTPFAVPIVLDAVEDRDQRVRLAALGVLFWYGEIPAAEEVVHVASRAKDPVTRALAAELLYVFETPTSRERLIELLADADAGVRATAFSMLHRRDTSRAMQDVARFAVADDWRERVAAVFACKRSRSREAVDHLVALVGDERRVVSFLAHHWLRCLSGLDYGEDPELWTTWWKGARDGWEPPEGDLKPPDTGTNARYARFHGMPITSDHIVFVIDDSNSMNKLMDKDGPEDGPSRWERTVEELTAALDALPDETHVNVILFGETVRPVFKSPRPLTEKSRDKLREALLVDPQESSTNLLGAMDAALRQDADTIYLLGDGVPNAGDVVMTLRVRRVIDRLNTHARRRISVISIGVLTDWAIEMMKGIATDSGGGYAHRRK